MSPSPSNLRHTIVSCPVPWGHALALSTWDGKRLGSCLHARSGLDRQGAAKHGTGGLTPYETPEGSPDIDAPPPPVLLVVTPEPGTRSEQTTRDPASSSGVDRHE